MSKINLHNWQASLFKKYIFYIVSIVVIVNYHLMKVAWCGPHIISFCHPYQESHIILFCHPYQEFYCREISTGNLAHTVRLLQGAINPNKESPGQAVNEKLYFTLYQPS